MSSFTKTITVHEHSGVAPPDAGGESKAYPFTYFDMIWLYFHPIQRLLFYKFPYSRAQFLETIIPHLKTSLSQTLKHYLILAGKIYLPSNSSDLPEFRCVQGDSVSFTIAETTEAFDFNYLSGNEARDCDQFYPFVAQLPEPKFDSELGFNIISLFSIQVTLFPDTGICIGFTNNHCAGDASSIVGFIKSWSKISKLEANSDDQSIQFPFYDRSIIKDPSYHRANIFYDQMKKSEIRFPVPKLPTNKFRQTFVLQKADIQKLRTCVSSKRPDLNHLSSFTITSAYVWSCLTKSLQENVDGNDPEYLILAVDARHRLDPPVPANYFGNCVAIVVTETTHGKLKDDEGFINGVEVVGDLISKKVNNKEEIMKDADDWLINFGPLLGNRVFGVAGSPMFDLYDTDFGWGKPVKYEAISIDGETSMSLCKSREFEGGLEIGFSLAKTRLEAFAAAFYDGLKML